MFLYLFHSMESINGRPSLASGILLLIPILIVNAIIRAIDKNYSPIAKYDWEYKPKPKSTDESNESVVDVEPHADNEHRDSNAE